MRDAGPETVGLGGDAGFAIDELCDLGRVA